MTTGQAQIDVTVEDMADYYVNRNTRFETSETLADVIVESDESNRGEVCLTIDGQFFQRKDIKELRAFLKCLLADMKEEA